MQRFTLTGEHVKLLRAARVSWNEAEWGAPTVDPKRPYGNGDIDRDIHRVLTGDEVEWDEGYGLPSDMTPARWHELMRRYRVLHHETVVALQVVLSTGSFEPGVYEAPDYSVAWSPLARIPDLSGGD